MSSVIISKTYEELPFREREILRYAGCRESEAETEKLMLACIDEARDVLRYRVCYRILPVTVCGDECSFDYFTATSHGLTRNLGGCDRAVVFAATVGVGIDRLIAKYGRLSPSRALMLQALGAERIETLCDTFCAEIEAETGEKLRPRFSAGYGDLDLKVQRDIFSVLDCEKRIGLTLNESLLMSPSKSVTAFAGLGCAKTENKQNKCSSCGKADCIFGRGAI